MTGCFPSDINCHCICHTKYVEDCYCSCRFRSAWKNKESQQTMPDKFAELHERITALEALLHDESHERGNIWSRLEYLEAFDESLMKAQHPRLLQERIATLEKAKDRKWRKIYCVLCNKYLADYVKEEIQIEELCHCICFDCHAKLPKDYQKIK